MYPSPIPTSAPLSLLSPRLPFTYASTRHVAQGVAQGRDGSRGGRSGAAASVDPHQEAAPVRALGAVLSRNCVRADVSVIVRATSRTPCPRSLPLVPPRPAFLHSQVPQRAIHAVGDVLECAYRLAGGHFERRGGRPQ